MTSRSGAQVAERIRIRVLRTEAICGRPQEATQRPTEIEFAKVQSSKRHRRSISASSYSVAALAGGRKLLQYYQYVTHVGTVFALQPVLPSGRS